MSTTSTTTRSDDVDDDGDSNDNDANNKDGGDGNNDDGEVEHDGGDDNDNDDDVNIDVIKDDDEMVTRTIGRRRCDGDGRPATRKTLTSAARPIQRNHQLMSTVWGGVDEREGQFWGRG